MLAQFASPLRLAPLLIGLTALIASASPPAWWATKGATSAQPADDYGAANTGQLKHFAHCAYDELHDRVPANFWVTSSGQSLYALLRSWHQDDALTVPITAGADDFAAVNQGQLKYVTAKFYDALRTADYADATLLPGGQKYPWSLTEADDDSFAVVNLGQLKYVFSFVPANLPAHNPGDTDWDHLLDSWETAHFGNLSPVEADDHDGDGFANLLEYQAGTNPLFRSANALGLEIYTP